MPQIVTELFSIRNRCRECTTESAVQTLYTYFAIELNRLVNHKLISEYLYNYSGDIDVVATATQMLDNELCYN